MSSGTEPAARTKKSVRTKIFQVEREFNKLTLSYVYDSSTWTVAFKDSYVEEYNEQKKLAYSQKRLKKHHRPFIWAFI